MALKKTMQALGAEDDTGDGYPIPQEELDYLDMLKKKMSAPAAPRYTPEQVADRRRANDRDYALGMMGMVSQNENLQRVGQQMYSDAMKQRQPTITEHGQSDPLSGEFSYDPDYLQQRTEDQYGQELNRIGSQRAAHDAAKASRDDRLAQADANRQLRREIAAGNNANRNANQNQQQDSRTAALEDRMYDDFNNATKQPSAVLLAHQNLKAIATRTDPMANIALLYAYMKILDPTTGVKEGEFATAQNAGNIPTRVLNQYNSAVKGERIDPTQRAQILATSNGIAHQSQLLINDYAKQTREKARRRGLNPDNILSGRFVLPDDAPDAQGIPETVDGAPMPTPVPRPAAAASRPGTNFPRTRSRAIDPNAELPE